MGPPGCHTTVREPKRAHLRVPVFKNTTKIQREDIQRGKKRTNFAAGEGKKRAKFWAVPEAVPGRAVPGRAVPGKGGPGKGGPGGTEHDQTKTLKPPHGNRETNTHTQTHTNTHKHTQTHGVRGVHLGVRVVGPPQPTPQRSNVARVVTTGAVVLISAAVGTDEGCHGLPSRDQPESDAKKMGHSRVKRLVVVVVHISEKMFERLTFVTSQLWLFHLLQSFSLFLDFLHCFFVRYF